MTAHLSVAVTGTTPLAEVSMQGFLPCKGKLTPFADCSLIYYAPHPLRPTPCSGTGYASRSADDFSPALCLMVQAVANG